MRGGQPLDVLVKGCLFVVIVTREKAGELHLVQLACNGGDAPQRLDFSGEGEIFRRAEIIKWFRSKVIAGAEYTLISPVPEGERKIAEQVVNAAFAPPFVGGEDQFAVGSFALWFGNGERGKQFVTVIDSCICCEDKLSIGTYQWKRFGLRFGRCPEHTLPDTNGTLVPHAQIVTPTVGHGVKH